MARVEMASQAWGWLVDSSGNPLPGTAATLQNLDGSNATTWSAITGGSSSTASVTSNSDATLPRFIESGTYNMTVLGVTRRVEAVSESTTVRNSNAVNPINVATVYQSESGADATLTTTWHGLYNVPSKAGISTLADYADSSTASTTIYQLTGGVYNTGTRPAVGVAGFARGKLVWGSNLVVMADGTSSVATGMEIDFGIVTTSVGVANGMELHAHQASGNTGHYLGMLARNGLEAPGPRVGIQISVNGTDQPLVSTGTIFETSGAIQTTHGIDFHSSAFSGEAAWLPVNRGSAGASLGLKIECRGGFANSGSALQISSVDASSTVTYGIRFASASGANPPVASGGKLIYVDGGSYSQALDISAASFAASGAIVMGDNNISFGTTTGTKIGTGTTQKLAFYNSTPIVQYATTGTSVGFTAGAGTAVTHLSTFTGNTGAAAYTIADVVRALKQLGLIAA